LGRAGETLRATDTSSQALTAPAWREIAADRSSRRVELISFAYTSVGR